MDFIYYIFKDFIHYSAMVLLAIVLPLAIIAVVKPQILSKRINTYSNRKKIISTSLVSVAILIGLISISSPTNFGQVNVENSSGDENQGAIQKEKYFQADEIDEVEKKLVEETKTIPFETQEIKSDKIAAGQKKQLQKGVNGKIIQTFEIDYKDNKEVSRKLKNEIISIKAIPQIYLVSTRQAPKESKAKKQCDSFFDSFKTKNKSCYYNSY